ncbi:MAG: FAD-dependent oxidoreductase, partial [Planctomycetota bacterium]|nr:FAD-dependent oxidoreductase [Planctomycetota bacterium]
TPEANLTTAAPNEPTRNAATHRSIEPTIIINATGAWGDRTLEAIGVHERQLFAGTKGSHLFTTYAPLIKALNGNGIYSEAHDGRLVFILPCAAGVLIGTTDDPYSGDPGEAVSTPADVDYLVQMVNEVFPGVALTADHVDMHHAGVRPLPTSDSSSAAAIPRGHSIEESTLNGIPVLTLVGGKLTTCRTLAEQVSKLVCRRLNHEHSRNTDDRLIPGADGIPADVALSEHHSHLATKHSLSLQQVETVWRLIGNRFDEVFPNTNSKSNAATTHDSITGTFIPREFVRWSIDYEWCTRLEDLVERRLMLTFVPQVRRDTLRDLGEQLINAQRLDRSQLESEVEQVCARLGRYYGKTIEPD